MSLAQSEVAKRRSVRAMLERLEPDTQCGADQSLLTRQEMFGGFSGRSEEGFQQRCLVRMCKLGLLDSLVLHPNRTRVYAVRDSSKVLDALTDDEALTRLIWHRPDLPELGEPPPSPSLPSVPEPSAPAPDSSAPSGGVIEGGTSASLLAELASTSDEGLQATTLKLLAGMVESLYYLRVKIEGIEQKLDAMTQGTK